MGVRSAAREAGDNGVVRVGARLGYAVNGLVHLLIGWLGVQLVLGGRGETADQSGALDVLAQNPLGRILLFVMVAGFALLALFQVSELVSAEGVGDRLKAVGKFLVYLALAWSALTFALGGHSRSTSQTRDVTAALMSAPLGQVLVGVVGAGIVAVGGYHLWKGWTKKFLDDLERHPGGWVEVAGRIGYVAKGIALAAVGVLFVVAAWRHRPSASSGLDGALRALLDLPLGSALVLAIGLGFACYAVYSFARARFARLGSSRRR
ncbi:MAG: DUF1206 domain-containing protein [Micropruina sp.]|nr:MAG: DUF1206 domain-containing protein [Micropruina sp.]